MRLPGSWPLLPHVVEEGLREPALRLVAAQRVGIRRRGFSAGGEGARGRGLPGPREVGGDADEDHPGDDRVRGDGSGPRRAPGPPACASGALSRPWHASRPRRHAISSVSHGIPRRGLAVVLLLAAGAAADVAVPEAGPVFRGGVEVHVEKGEALLGGAPRPLRELLLVERDDGRLVYSDGFDRRVAGYRRMAYEGHRDRLVELIREATKARDAELARRLLEQARAEGFSGKEEDIQRRRLENLEKHPGKRDETKSAELRRVAAGLTLLRAPCSESSPNPWSRSSTAPDGCRQSRPCTGWPSSASSEWSTSWLPTCSSPSERERGSCSAPSDGSSCWCRSCG